MLNIYRNLFSFTKPFYATSIQNLKWEIRHKKLSKRHTLKIGYINKFELFLVRHNEINNWKLMNFAACTNTIKSPIVTRHEGYTASGQKWIIGTQLWEVSCLIAGCSRSYLDRRDRWWASGKLLFSYSSNGSMLAQRHRRRSNIGPSLDQCPVFLSSSSIVTWHVWPTTSKCEPFQRWDRQQNLTYIDVRLTSMYVRLCRLKSVPALEQ